jgi:hypothetical protein
MLLRTRGAACSSANSSQSCGSRISIGITRVANYAGVELAGVGLVLAKIFAS